LGGGPLGRRVVVGGPAGGVGADRFVDGVSARGGLLRSVVAAQVVQVGLGGGQVGVGQRCGGNPIDARWHSTPRRDQEVTSRAVLDRGDVNDH
jgi:hypothetical protein